MCVLSAPRLSVGLQQSLSLPGLFCALDSKLRITEGTPVPVDRLDMDVALKWSFYPPSALTPQHVDPRGSSFSCDSVEL